MTDTAGMEEACQGSRAGCCGIGEGGDCSGQQATRSLLGATQPEADSPSSPLRRGRAGKPSRSPVPRERQGRWSLLLAKEAAPHVHEGLTDGLCSDGPQRL